MRDRLIELIINADAYDSYECKLCNKDDDACDCCYAEKLADKLLANGVVCPPCKVGDTVYEIQPIRKRVQAYEITTIKYNGHYWWFTWILKDRKGIYGNVDGFSSHQIGKTIFLTREEAERALKGEKVLCL